MILEGIPIPFYGDGSSRRDYTFVDDAVADLIAALKCKNSTCEIINVGNGRTVSLNDMVGILKKSYEKGR